MKNKLLAPTLLSLGFFILLTPSLAFAQDTPEPVELKLELREEITENQVKELLQDKDYLITNLKGEVKVGEETITDFISKGKGETLEDVDELFQEQRQTLLVNMLQTQELSEENSEEIKQQFSRDELLTTIRETKKAPAKVKEISVITENREKADNIKASLQNRSEIKDIRESNKEVQAQEIKEKKEVKQENRALRWLRNTLNFLFAPLRAIATGTTPAWVPDFTSIAFFDTDEVGLNPYEDWESFDNNWKEVRDIESHWWDTYVIADYGTGAGGQDVIGHFRNDDGTDFSGWRQLPQHQGMHPDLTHHHELVSQGNVLYQYYTAGTTFSNSPNDLFVRASYDGGYTWTSETKITNNIKAYTATSHNNQVCIVFQDISNNVLKNKCVADPLSTNWTTLTWNEYAIIPLLSGGNTNIDLESQFGSLWLVYRANNEVELLNSYDNGVTWNDVLFGDSQIEEDERKQGVYSPELTAIGTFQWQNERLCLSGIMQDYQMLEDPVGQTCLYRYFDENGQYNAWNWTPWQIQEQVYIGAHTAVETTSDTTRMTQVSGVWSDTYIRTLEYQPNPGRGYISYVRWDEQSDIDAIDSYTRPSYEHEIRLYGDPDEPYNDKVYMSKENQAEGDCMPKVNYLASTLPNPYLDTRRDVDIVPQQNVCDSELAPGESHYEVSYTIGTTRPEQLNHNQYYFTYFQTERGELGAPVFKVQAELSKHVVGCEDATWCVIQGKYDNGAKKIIPPEGASNPWVNALSQNPNPFQGGSYPYWYYDTSQ